MKTVRFALAAALLATGGSAVAQTATDARCILLANAFAGQSSDSKQQKVAEDTLYFYLGRMAQTPTAAQMKAALEQQGKSITDANAGKLMNDCIKPVVARIQVLESLAADDKAAPAPATKAPATKAPAPSEGR